jgi:hypothetical protein
VHSCLPAVADATCAAVSPDGGTPAGTVVLRAAGLRVRGGGTVTAGGAVPAAGELAVFCRSTSTSGPHDGRKRSHNIPGQRLRHGSGTLHVE